MKRCTIIIPDAGPINSLWVADQLPLLLALEMKIVMLDSVYDELVSEPDTYMKDKDVLDFILSNQPPFSIETTEIGIEERAKRIQAKKLRKNAGELAITDFMTSDGGLRKYLRPGEPVVILFEDSAVRVINKPPFLHLLSTVGLLRGLERVGVIESADSIIYQMTHPSAPGRRPTDRRFFSDLPDGIDDPALIGSTWEPTGP